jgi:hypothetical protein
MGRCAAAIAAVVAAGAAALGGTAESARGYSRWLAGCGPVARLAARVPYRPYVTFGFAYAPKPLRSGQPVVWVVRVTNPSWVSSHLEFPESPQVDVLLSRPTAPPIAGPTFARARAAAYAWSLHHAELGNGTVRELRPRTAFTCVLKDVLNVAPGRYKLLALLNLATPGAPFYVRKTVVVSRPCRPCD